LKVKIYSIIKDKNDDFTPLIKNFKKMISRFAKIEDYPLYDKKISAVSEFEAKKFYSKILIPKIGNFNIALDLSGKAVDSYQFSQLITDRNEINFFIGGAWGFEDDFLRKCDRIISLSNLTFSHKLAKVLLYEQIYRGFTIINKHPYHK